jgi:hypothetical protein
MTDDRTLERAARSWLEEGPTRAPDRAVDAALSRTQTTRQERGPWIPWRFPTMNPITRAAAIAAVLAVAVGVALFAMRPTSNVGPPATAGPTPTAPPSIEGSWEAQFTHQQFLDAGLVDAAEDNPENWGHFRMTFTGRADGTGGAFYIAQLDGPLSTGSGTYSIAGSTLTIRCSGWCDTDAVFVLSFSVTATTLTIGAPGPTTFRVEPWVRVSEPTKS